MDNSKTYCVYEHLFPNGKRYIGISQNANVRWRNGDGYKTQEKIWKAIEAYGWDNIEHNIIVDGLTKEQAMTLEQRFISAYDTLVNGYNATIGGEEILGTYLSAHILKMITESKRFDKIYGLEQKDDDIVSLADAARYNQHLANIFNKADNMVMTTYKEFARYKGAGALYDLENERCDCYWWTMAQIIDGKVDQLSKSPTPYWDKVQAEIENVIECHIPSVV